MEMKIVRALAAHSRVAEAGELMSWLFLQFFIVLLLQYKNTF